MPDVTSTSTRSKFLDALTKLRKATFTLFMPVRPSVHFPASKIWVLNLTKVHATLYLRNFFSENQSSKFKFNQNPTRLNGTLHEELCIRTCTTDLNNII